MRTLNPREGKLFNKEMTDLSFQKGIFNLPRRNVPRCDSTHLFQKFVIKTE